MQVSDLANWAAVFISLLALALTIYEARSTRIHNMLSVAPRLTDNFSIVPTSERATISVVNCGLGPATVKSSQLRIQGKKREEFGISNWEELTKHLNLDDGTTYDWPHPSSIIAPGDSITLIATPVGEYSRKRAKAIRAAFRQLQFRISYTSIYGESATSLVVDGENRYPPE